MIAFLTAGLLCALTSAAPAQIVETRLTAGDAAVGDFLGNAVAIDGFTAVVAAFSDDDRGVDSGSVYVYRQSDTGWVQTAKLTASDGTAGDFFGSAIAIHGQTIVVGAEGDASQGASTGAAYVFELQGTQWVQTAKLLPTDLQANDHFGFAVTIHGDTVSVGAWGRNNVAGVAYVFERANGAWTQTAAVTASDGAANDYFGHAVALHGDTLLVGSPADDDRGTNSGSAYVFARALNGAWSQVAKLVASDGAAADFFARVASISGDTLVIGARDNDDLGSSSGSAYVFQLQNGIWTETAKLLASDGRTGDVFGHSVGISKNRIAVGAKWRDDSAPTSGAAYLFERTAGTWRQIARLNASDPGSGDAFGQSIAIDGRTTIVGSWRRASTRGAAYVYQLPSVVDPSLSTVTAAETVISTFGGQTDILVTPRQADGSLVGAGLDVVLQANAGSLVGPVSDNGDGTYTQTFAGSSSPTSSAVISATADGIPLTATATVTLVQASLVTSTVAVNPQQVEAGQSATITVTPKTDTGANAGPGFTVVLQTTLGSLVGQVVDNGDGTYTQDMLADTVGTASIRATVDGLSLQDTASLTVVPRTIGDVVGFDAEGAPTVYRTIQHAVRMAPKHGLTRILVAPGSYNEFVHFNRLSNLTIETVPGQGLTTIRGLRIRHSSNIVVDGFAIDARGGNRSAVVIHTSEKVTMRNCWVQGTDTHRSGVIIGVFTQGALLQNCIVQNCGRDGIRVRTWSGDVSILGCRVHDNGRHGIHVTRSAEVTIGKCGIFGNGRATSRRCGGYGIIRKRTRGRRCVRPERVTLLQNDVTNNNGRVIECRSTADFGNHDQMIDDSDDQAPFSR